MSTTARVVLLGEPDQATCDLYQRGLRAAFDVVAASDEDTILQALHSRSIAALVLEPAIFAGRDWERLAAISRICAERGVQLVVCSTLDERRRGIGLGVAAYLIKPTLPATLLNTLRDVIGEG